MKSAILSHSGCNTKNHVFMYIHACMHENDIFDKNVKNVKKWHEGSFPRLESIGIRSKPTHKCQKCIKTPFWPHFGMLQKVKNKKNEVFVKNGPTFQKYQKMAWGRFTTLDYVGRMSKWPSCVKMTHLTHFWKKSTLVTLLIRAPSLLISDLWYHGMSKMTLLGHLSQKWQKAQRVIYKARLHWDPTQIGPKVSKTHKNPIWPLFNLFWTLSGWYLWYPPGSRFLIKIDLWSHV